MTPLGKVVRLQVQAEPLKSGEKPNKVYATAAIVEVERLLLTPTGAVGFDAAGAQILDVHNTAHPATRYTEGNTVSFGLTSHYARMRERFGPHMVDGCAGENILVETDAPLYLSELGERLGLRGANGEVLALANACVALPCVEFSKFAIQNQEATPAELKPVLQFLDEGTRGFYVTAAQEGTVRVGDELVALS